MKHRYLSVSTFVTNTDEFIGDGRKIIVGRAPVVEPPLLPSTKEILTDLQELSPSNPTWHYTVSDKIEGLVQRACPKRTGSEVNGRFESSRYSAPK